MNHCIPTDPETRRKLSDSGQVLLQSKQRGSISSRHDNSQPNPAAPITNVSPYRTVCVY